MRQGLTDWQSRFTGDVATGREGFREPLTTPIRFTPFIDERGFHATRGRKQVGLEAAFESVLEADLENRVLEFDSAAAASAARLAADRQSAGRTVDLRDTLIAGIAQTRRATIATRNTRHFESFDVPVVDPWKA